MTTKRSLATVAFTVVALSQLGATDCGQALRDPGFDLWCGKALCAWTVERGTVAKVPTWNEGDPGVAFAGTDVAIAQLSPVVGTDANASCVEFDLIANVDENAELDLNVDLNGDGSFEFTERIPTSRWQPLAFKLPIANTYSGIRFELAKKGSGNAAVAQLEAKTTTGCGGLTPIVPAPAPNGALCVMALGGADCQSGRCGGTPLFVGVCTGCDGGAGECATNETCGLGDAKSPTYDVPLECVPQHARALGEQCLFDIECAAGFCTAGVCSTCRVDGTGCTGGARCDPAWPGLGVVNNVPVETPYECNPNKHAGATGDPCASNADCTSSACVGAPRMQCGDGRACASDSDCPFEGLNHGPCTTVGVQGGTCR
jgi:hypothetical protein